MPRKPLVAVPAYPVVPGRIEGWVDAGIAVPEPYLASLKRAGAQEAVLMPEPISDADAGDLLDHFDGLLMLGGPDLDPETYGQEDGGHNYGISHVRDAFELTLLRAAIDRSLPTLAICRGAQVLNVLLGGTLDQHITGRKGLLGHGIPGVEGGAALHDLELDPGSKLASAMGVTQAECSSHHHQAVDKVGDGLTITARAPDGIVEGIELDGDAWIVGAQWHPEDTAGRDPAQQALFDALVHQAIRAMTGIPELDTERLRLRAWRDEDLDPYAALCADAEVMRWLHGPMTREESIAQVGAIRDHWAREGFGMWAVAPRETDGCIGFVGLGTPSHVPEVLPAVEIGWRLARPYWGQGLATEGARATVDFAFGPLALDRIVSITQLPNQASRRVMEKLGMTPERTTVHPEHGHDVIVYELLAPGAR